MSSVLVALALVGSQLTLYLAALAAGLEWKGRRPVPAGLQFDAVVVLGCRVQADGTASRALRQRTLAGAQAVRDGRAPKLVITGGAQGAGAISEAAAALPHALSVGLTPTQIVLEERALSTEDNAREVAALLGPDCAVLVVTDAYHVPRSVKLFRKHFAKVAGQGVADASFSRAKNALREACVLVVYLARGALD